MNSDTSVTRNSRRPLITILGFAAAAVSGAALVLHALGWMPLYFTVELLGLPSILILLILGIYAHRVHQDIFVKRLVTGLFAGVVATAAYDLIRLLIWVTGLIDFDPFLSHPLFGMLITGSGVDTPLAISVGWAYHYWNGLGFAIMYTLIAGPAHWAYALLWSMMLELAWISAMPAVAELRLNPQLVLVGVIGHIAYGAGLAVVARRRLRDS